MAERENQCYAARPLCHKVPGRSAVCEGKHGPIALSRKKSRFLACVRPHPALLWRLEQGHTDTHTPCIKLRLVDFKPRIQRTVWASCVAVDLASCASRANSSLSLYKQSDPQKFKHKTTCASAVGEDEQPGCNLRALGSPSFFFFLVASSASSSTHRTRHICTQERTGLGDQVKPSSPRLLPWTLDTRTTSKTRAGGRQEASRPPTSTPH